MPGCTSSATCCRWCPAATSTWPPAVFRHHLRPTRCRRGDRSLGPGRRPARRQLPQGGPAHGHSTKAEVLAFAAFPRAHWQKIWSTNPLERINKEIKRRSRVVGIFPNEASAIRLVGAILADLHDEWQTTDRRYLSADSMSLLYPERDAFAAAELKAGC